MGRRIWAGALALVLSLPLAACGGSGAETPAPSETPASPAAESPVPSAEPMEFALACFPSGGFDPIAGTDRTNSVLAGLQYDGLYELDQNFRPQPALAVSGAASEDGRTWTFVLRQGVTFSDGSPLTAAEVVSSLTAAKASERYAQRLTGISAVRAGADGSVEVVLSSPNGDLPALLDIPIVKKSAGPAPLGTGWYVLEQSGESWLLRRRPESWREAAHAPETIPLRTVEGTAGLTSAFDSRDVSLVDTDLTGIGALNLSGSFETTDYATTDLLYLGFNTASGACRSTAVRLAVSRGIDRDSLCSAVLSRHAAASALPVHPHAALYDADSAAALDRDPEGMETALTDGGWSKDDSGAWKRGRSALSLTLVVGQDSSYKSSAAGDIARQLNAAGFDVTVQRLAWEDYLSALQNGKFDLYLGEVKLTADFDPSPLLPGGALNYGRYSDQAMAALLSAFRAAQGEKRISAAQALYARLGETVPFAPLCFKNWSVLSQWGQLTGLAPTQQNVFYQFGNWNFAD